MLELTGIASIFRAVGALYWLAALAAIAAALYFPKGKVRKTAATAIAIALFGYLPVKNWLEAREREAYAQAAWAHFKKLCAEKSGEKIYKTFAGVKSVLVIKPLPPATDKDHFDQFWYGDPYSSSATSVRTILAISTLAWSEGPNSKTERGRAFAFVESVLLGADATSKKYIRVTYPPGARDHLAIEIDRPESQFAIAWEDISTPEDRALWIAGSRLSVVDLATSKIVAERVGYFIEAGFGSRAGGRRPWLTSRGPRTTCPAVHDYLDRWFLMKVLGPTFGDAHGK